MTETIAAPSARWAEDIPQAERELLASELATAERRLREHRSSSERDHGHSPARADTAHELSGVIADLASSRWPASLNDRKRMEANIAEARMRGVPDHLTPLAYLGGEVA